MKSGKYFAFLLFLFFHAYVLASDSPDTTILPELAGEYPVKILVPGTYELSEIDYDANTMEWYALVSNGVTYSVKKAKADHSKVKDTVTGKEMWVIKGEDSLNTILLFSGVEMLEQDVYDMKLGKKSFNAGDRMEFNYKGKKFLLTAEAWEKIDRKTKKKYLGKYELYFSPLKKEKERQLIAYHQRVDNQKPEIIFLGDIDNDKVPDMILNNSVNDEIHLVFYLSNNPKKGTYYKTMGVFNYKKQ